MRVRRLAAGAVDPDLYLAGANLSFGHWGDPATFAWVFRDDAELLFIEDAAGQVIAASGITWRTFPGGPPAAITTGAWTLPQARGAGAFSSILETMFRVAAERNAVTLGLGTMANASGRRLAAAGANLHPTFYCRSVRVSGPDIPLETVDPDPDVFLTDFVYTPAEWRMQFLQRPHAHIECVGQRGTWAAVVERASEFDRVHAISDAGFIPLLAARAHARGRRLFWFSTTPPAIECEWTDGFLGTFPPMIRTWRMQNGDRM